MAALSKARRVAAFCLGLAAGSLLVEASLRLIEATPLWRALPVADASLYGPDEASGYAHRPGASGIRTPENRVYIEISSLGLRDRADRTMAKPAGATRWAVIGDSIVESQQVPLEQTFAYLAEAELSRAASLGGLGKRVEVLNLGLAGATPAVIVERLNSRGPQLDLDGLIVMVSIGELLLTSPDDASQFAGYVPGPDGRAIVAHDFRRTRGHELRSGPYGEAIYWALEHSRLALLVNNRKNAGLLAELASSPPPRPSDPCGGKGLAAQEALFGPEPPGFSGARLAAFLADLRAIAFGRPIPIVVAFRGLATGCPALAERENALAHAIQRRLAEAGLGFADVDREVATRLPNGVSASHLLGFGARLGNGHLNPAGQRIYSEVLVDIVERANFKGATPSR